MVTSTLCCHGVLSRVGTGWLQNQPRLQKLGGAAKESRGATIPLSYHKNTKDLRKYWDFMQKRLKKIH